MEAPPRLADDPAQPLEGVEDAKASGASCCGPVSSCCGGAAFDGTTDPITSNLYVLGENGDTASRVAVKFVDTREWIPGRVVKISTDPDEDLEKKLREHPHDKSAKVDVASDESMDASDPSSATQPSAGTPVPRPCSEPPRTPPIMRAHTRPRSTSAACSAKSSGTGTGEATCSVKTAR